MSCSGNIIFGGGRTYADINVENIEIYSDIGKYIAVQQPIYNEGGGCQGFQRADMLMASGTEASQFFINAVSSRHCLSAPEWKRYCSLDGEVYTPSLAPPFSIAGYPSNVKNFWDEYKNNIVQLGSGLGYQWEDTPWTNYGGASSWSGVRRTCEYVDGNYPSSGTVPFTSMYRYGHALKSEFNKVLPALSDKGTPQFYHLGKLTNDYSFTRRYPLTEVSSGISTIVVPLSSFPPSFVANQTIVGTCPQRGLYASGSYTNTQTNRSIKLQTVADIGQ
jgi:hypothetical protein